VTHDCGSALVLIGFGELDLNTVDTVDAINEENKDKNEGNLHSILQFCYKRTLADEGEHFSADSEGKGDDEKHEECHLGHKEDEDKAIIKRHVYDCIPLVLR